MPDECCANCIWFQHGWCDNFEEEVDENGYCEEFEEEDFFDGRVEYPFVN